MQIDVDGLLFDSDGVLVDSHQATVDAWTRLSEEFELDIDVLLTELVGVRAADTLGRHLDQHTLSTAIARLEDLEVGSAGGTKALPGARQLLAALPADSWTIVTSASRRLGSRRWEGAGIPVPPVAVTAEEVQRGKPDPEPFLEGARRLGFDPTRCAVFEDSPSGGAAGRAAGAFVVAIGDHPWDIEPDVRIQDLSAVVLLQPDSPGVALELHPSGGATSS